MKGFLITLASVLFLALVGVATYAFMVAGDRNYLQEELAAVRGELDTTRTDLALSETELTTTKNNLSSAQAYLTTAHETLTTTEDELSSTIEELRTTEDALDTAMHDLFTTGLELDRVQDELGIAQIRIDRTKQQLDELWHESLAAFETLHAMGIIISSSQDNYDAELVDNPDAVNPTWAELKAFLAEDQTEQHEYILDVYDCSQFSRDLHNRAEAAGIRAAVVHIELLGEAMGHALNAFITTDYGLVYVDCTHPNDRIAWIKFQHEFRAVLVPDISIQNVRNDSWWATLSTCLYLISSSGEPLKVGYIIIYW